MFNLIYINANQSISQIRLTLSNFATTVLARGFFGLTNEEDKSLLNKTLDKKEIHYDGWKSASKSLVSNRGHRSIKGTSSASKQ